jgi:hypothetical protein
LNQFQSRSHGNSDAKSACSHGYRIVAERISGRRGWLKILASFPLMASERTHSLSLQGCSRPLYRSHRGMISVRTTSFQTNSNTYHRSPLRRHTTDSAPLHHRCHGNTGWSPCGTNISTHLGRRISVGRPSWPLALHILEPTDGTVEREESWRMVGKPETRAATGRRSLLNISKTARQCECTMSGVPISQ